MMDNLEPLEPLNSLCPEQGFEKAVAWDSDDELVAFLVRNVHLFTARLLNSILKIPRMTPFPSAVRGIR
jgi:hypothetical protein